MANKKNKPTVTLKTKKDVVKDGMSVDPTIEQHESQKSEGIQANQAKAKASHDKIVARSTAVMKGEQIGVLSRNTVKEQSEELIDAISKDAEVRKKKTNICPITGVIVVT